MLHEVEFSMRHRCYNAKLIQKQKNNSDPSELFFTKLVMVGLVNFGLTIGH